jgi:hypothetical protein
VFVFPQHIVQLNHVEQYMANTKRQPGDLKQTIKAIEREATCCSITDDYQYLILGTKNGILVHDLAEKYSILHTNISDEIVSVDVKTLDDDIYKYVLISSSTKGGNVINIHSLMVPEGEQTLKWASDKMGSPINCYTDLKNRKTDLNSWLLGKTFFDIYTEDGQLMLVAVDSKDTFKLIPYHERKKDFQQMTTNRISLKAKVTAFAKFDHFCAIGCSNGLVQLVQFDGEMITNQELFRVPGPVSFLKHFGQNNLVIGYNEMALVVDEDSREELFSEGDFEIVECYQLDDERLIMISLECFLLVSSQRESS